jgi:hypothetical protein
MVAIAVGIAAGIGVAAAATPAEALPARTAPHSAITTMWAWGNSVDPSADNRGLGQPGMAPRAVAGFAAKHSLRTVYLSTPWAADQGALGAWLSDTVDALHAKGIRVAALGGDAPWLDQPALAAQWIRDARAAAAFDAIQLNVEPWAGRPDLDYAATVPKFLDLLSVARTAAGPLQLGLDLPWWLTTKSYGAGTAFEAVLERVDSVAIVTFADHPDGADGIVALSSAAADAASARGTPFTIGLETDTPEIAGGSQYTFFDDGRAALESAARSVRTAFGQRPGYSGVSVEHLLAWKSLKP